MANTNPVTSSGRLRKFRVLAINGDHIAIAGDCHSWQEAVDLRRMNEERLDREDQTWFDITPLFEAAESEVEAKAIAEFDARMELLEQMGHSRPRVSR